MSKVPPTEFGELHVAEVFESPPFTAFMMSFLCLGKTLESPTKEPKCECKPFELNPLPTANSWLEKPRSFIVQLPHQEHRDYHLSHVRVSISS